MRSLGSIRSLIGTIYFSQQVPAAADESVVARPESPSLLVTSALAGCGDPECPIAEGNRVYILRQGTSVFYAAQCEKFAAEFRKNAIGVPRMDHDFADLAPFVGRADLN